MKQISENLVKSLKKKKLTLAVAESCTGGLLSSSITGIGGSSKVFTGTGDLLSISPIEETSTLQMNGITVALTGIKSSLISTALSAQYTNRNGALYMGLFDASASVIADVYTLFKGKMDIMKIDEGPESATITLNLENRLIALDRPLNRRFTHEDQQERFSGDLGLEFVPDLQDKEIIWGKKTS